MIPRTLLEEQSSGMPTTFSPRPSELHFQPGYTSVENHEFIHVLEAKAFGDKREIPTW